MNEHENETFRKAARDAGIRGSDWRGNVALKDFSTYYHNRWDKWDREGDGYEGVYRKARNWWFDNKHKYS